jgi:hypothetical protein
MEITPKKCFISSCPKEPTSCHESISKTNNNSCNQEKKEIRNIVGWKKLNSHLDCMHVVMLDMEGGVILPSTYRSRR